MDGKIFQNAVILHLPNSNKYFVLKDKKHRKRENYLKIVDFRMFYNRINSNIHLKISI